MTKLWLLDCLHEEPNQAKIAVDQTVSGNANP